MGMRDRPPLRRRSVCDVEFPLQHSTGKARGEEKTAEIQGEIGQETDASEKCRRESQGETPIRDPRNTRVRDGAGRQRSEIDAGWETLAR